MYSPGSTYRVQFNKNFTFRHLDAIIPYLSKLGIKTIYASPIFEAVPGSLHGYDIINPFRINPEIGTENELYAISKKLKSLNMGWLQDIVPNHMAFHSGNLCLMDVLEKGTLSVYADFFDVTWSNDLFHGRVMVPFLTETVEEAIDSKKLYLTYLQDRLQLFYEGSGYPVHVRTYEVVLNCTFKHAPEVVKIFLEQLNSIHSVSEPVNYAFRWHEFLLQFSAMMKNPETKKFIDDCILQINENSAKLKHITDIQIYRLCPWQETDQKINYRRFFTINGLICLNMHSESVFYIYHQKIRQLLQDGVFQGLRVDHIDGLYNPDEYLQRLRKLSGEKTYIIVEKILEHDEQLPVLWPIQGTTGYDFLALVNNLFTNRKSEVIFSRFYQSLTGDKRSALERVRDKKAYVLFQHMGGELDNLYQFFLELNLVEASELEPIISDDLKKAIGEFLLQYPVYRFYFYKFPLTVEQQEALQNVFKRCLESKPELTIAFKLLEEALITPPQVDYQKKGEHAIRFLNRCMQFTGPLMAKGVEDTFMYTFNRFVAHNEVGDSPVVFGISIDEFHSAMIARQKNWPLSLNTTSTHDTKRGEDVRMRLNVLSLLAAEWIEKVQEWREFNRSLRENGVPDVNEEYFIYQTLVGAYPVTEEDDFSNRFEEYLTKALREGKRHTDWSSPNREYENTCKKFGKELLKKNRIFWRSFYLFQQKVADFGMINSLAQVLLKFTCPGIPDIYQGTLSWDFNLVDPDNRRPINYDVVKKWITGEFEYESLARLWPSRNNAHVKEWLIQTLLRIRDQYTKIFDEGVYMPLRTEGKYKKNVIAFARRLADQWFVVIAPVNLVELCNDQRCSIPDIDWKDTAIILPGEAPLEYEHLLDSLKGKQKHGIPLKEAFQNFPLALIQLTRKKSQRGSGIMLPIFSLPSPYGIGDLGPEARNFADFLGRTSQTYWQLLPINPVTKENFYSPYSSYSSMAGNALLISPELLVESGLLEKHDLEDFHYDQTNKVDYLQAKKIRHVLLDRAWNNFNALKPVNWEQGFKEFQLRENYWLKDFALYELIKNIHENKPWNEWPDEFKYRDKRTLQRIEKEYRSSLSKVKWDQFIFHDQWKKLHQHCLKLRVQLFGDIPFYVSYDSADVWSFPEIFCLDENRNMKSVSGVPPDYFNSDGQLWGTPIYNWKYLREKKYKWWFDRIKKNLEMFDIARFDHFRAFYNYWEVPANEPTAKGGKWKEGPGIDFFRLLKDELGELPFIAEDLGEIDEGVFKLRDQLGLAGMKILQFAFEGDVSSSIYIPYQYTSNFAVYTGTHDNNTTRGWYRQNIGREQRELIEQYFGRAIGEKSVADALISLAYSSVAKIAIVPVQDILNLDERARVNIPSTRAGNWMWRMKPGDLNEDIEKKLQRWTFIYGRN